MQKQQGHLVSRMEKDSPHFPANVNWCRATDLHWLHQMLSERQVIRKQTLKIAFTSDLTSLLSHLFQISQHPSYYLLFQCSKDL